MTLLPTNTIPDDQYQQTRQQFGEKELVDLTLAIIAINGWNRLAVPFRTVPGSYHAAKQPDEHAVHA